MTNQSIELFSVIPERKLVKTVRSQSAPTAWYHLLASDGGLLVTSPTAATNSLTPFAFKNGYIYKLPKIEYEKSEQTEIRERDVSILKLHDSRIFVSVVVHGQRSSSNSSTKEIHLHEFKDLTSASASSRSRELLVVPVAASANNLAINVVDNLILVHVRATRITYVYDLVMSASSGSSDSDGSSGTVRRHHPVCTGQVVLAAEEEELPDEEGGASSDTLLYSNQWVMFQPDIIVDAKAGFMWKLSLRLQSQTLPGIFSDFCSLVSFLQERTGGKHVLLEVLFERCRLSASSTADTQTLGLAFDLVNRQYRTHLDNEMQESVAQPYHHPLSPPPPAKKAPTARVILDQSDIFSHIFSPLVEECQDRADLKRQISVLVEYHRSLCGVGVPVQHFLSELLINLLVRGKFWYQLHQLLQYHVIADSKVLACLLLSFESVYPPSLQLALDMMHRMRNSKEEIFEILLSKGMIIPGIKYAARNDLNSLSVRKLLKTAVESEDEMVVFNAYAWVCETNAGFAGIFEDRLQESFGIGAGQLLS